MFGWNLLTFLHLVAMAFFVGGQIFLAAVLVPLMRAQENRDQLRAVARRFAYGSGVALAVLVVTGSMLAGHLQLWSDPALHTKLTLVLVVIAAIVWHTRKPQWHWLEGVAFLLSLAIVWLGVGLAN